MKFKGQGKINICGFEYKKNIADNRRGGFRAPKKNPCIRAWLGLYVSNKLGVTLVTYSLPSRF